jgi:hypothetical protein
MNIRSSWAGRACALAGMAMVATFASSGIAAADDIYNNLDGTIDAVAETMALNVGGSEGTTTLFVQPRNGDGDNGCNFEPAGGSLTISLASSDTNVAKVSPSTATFTGCGSTAALTVTPVAAGSATISATQVTETAAGTFDLAPATFTVSVTGRANTAPTVSVDGVDAGASYDVGDVPAATCSVTDTEDGPSSFAAELSGTLDADGLGTQTASCSYTDAGGLTASASETYSIVDTTPPGISYTLDPVSPDGDNDWYTGTVQLTWTVTETGSPNSLSKTGCVNQIISTDQAATSYTCSATSAGGSSGPVTATVKRDGNGPTVTYTSAAPAGPDGQNGWYVSPVTATFTATDLFSGVAGSTTGTTTSTDDGAAVVLDSPAFTDNAGNTTLAGAAESPAYKIDTVDPDAPAFVGGPADGGSYYFGSVPAQPSCTSDDDTSLLASCVVTGDASPGSVGAHTWTATATDNAGNTSETTIGYTVLAWTAKGFYSPVDMNGVVNTVKGGSTVPLKFELFAGSTELTDVAAVDTFTAQKITCGTDAVLDSLEVVSTGGTSLRYDATGGQFIQNWKTPTGAGTCYKTTMTADDGSKMSALFKIK